MKKLILIAVFGISTLAAFGQGALTFGNDFAGVFRQPIFAPDPSSPNVQEVGNPPSSIGNPGPIPAGSTIFGGALLQLGYDVALYAGPTNITDPTALTLITTAQFRTATANVLPAGLVLFQTPAGPALAQTVTVPGVAAGQLANFQLRAWSTEGGTVTTWDQALLNFESFDPNAQIGETPIVTSAPLGGGSIQTPETIGWQSFSLTEVVPEPSSLALVGLGACGWVLFRRRR